MLTIALAYQYKKEGSTRRGGPLRGISTNPCLAGLLSVIARQYTAAGDTYHRGHIRYYGVPMNRSALWIFRFQVGRVWQRALSRRSQNAHVLWARMRRLIDRWLPPARTCHPYPLRRMGVIT